MDDAVGDGVDAADDTLDDTLDDTDDAADAAVGGQMDDITLDRALIFGVLQGGLDGYFKACESGVSGECTKDKKTGETVYKFFEEAEDGEVFAFFKTFLRAEKRLPSVEEIKAGTGVGILVPEQPYSITVFAERIVKRSLRNVMSDSFGEIAETLVKNPEQARKDMALLVRETAWSLGRITSYTDPGIARSILADYDRAKASTGELLGLSSPWEEVDEHSLGLQPGELTVLLAKRKVGKCVEASTPMMCPTTGKRLTIRQVVEEGVGGVLTWGQRRPIHSVRPDAYVDTGTKECLEVTWRSGRTLTATPEHPLMTSRGWKRLDELKEGHHTAAVAVLPEPLTPTTMSQRDIKLIAFMIAEGGCTALTPTFTSSVERIVSTVSECLRDWTCELRPRRDGRSGDYSIASDGTNELTALLREHGVMGKKSIEKAIPDAIFSLPNDQLGLFIGCLWSCDGCVSKTKQVSYSSGSRELVDQLQHLLLRFGVTSHIRIMPRETKDGPRDYYEVVVHRERIERFKLHIVPHMLGPKAEKAAAVTFQGRSRIGWLRNEELCDEIRAEMDVRPDLLSEVGEELGYGFKFQKGHVFDSKSGRIRRRVFSAFCAVYGSPLAWVLDENIQWDEIVKVEPVGEQRVFDLTVLPTQCFVANDVIVHNTWILLKWFQHILRNDLKEGGCLLFVSMEMPRKQIYRRLAALDLRLCYEDFRAGRLTVDEEERLNEWVEEMQTPDPDRPTIHVATAAEVRDVADICDKVAELNPRAVGIDGMYILGRDRRMGMWERTIQNCSEIKLDLCAGMDIAVLATTQLKGSKDKYSLEADADDAAYAKAIGDWADAMRGLFMSKRMEVDGKRMFTAMESREFRGVDFEMEFKLTTMDFSFDRFPPTKGNEDEETTATPGAEAAPVIDGTPGAGPEVSIEGAEATLPAPEGPPDPPDDPPDDPGDPGDPEPPEAVSF